MQAGWPLFCFSCLPVGRFLSWRKGVGRKRRMAERCPACAFWDGWGMGLPGGEGSPSGRVVAYLTVTFTLLPPTLTT